MNRERLLQRFLRYVKIDTTARENAGVYPSSPGQLELGRMLVATNCVRWACRRRAGRAWHRHGHRAGHVKHAVPTVAFNSHVDTSPETTGAGVKPQVIHNYAGGDITLPGDAASHSRCRQSGTDGLIGKTLITTDGTTLLGGDDKAASP